MIDVDLNANLDSQPPKEELPTLDSVNAKTEAIAQQASETQDKIQTLEERIQILEEKRKKEETTEELRPYKGE